MSKDVEDKPFQTPHTLRRKDLKKKIVEMFEGDTEAEEEERYERREARWSNKATNKMHCQIKACYCCLIGQLT